MSISLLFMITPAPSFLLFFYLDRCGMSKAIFRILRKGAKKERFLALVAMTTGRERTEFGLLDS
jgi:hypothetical protein